MTGKCATTPITLESALVLPTRWTTPFTDESRVYFNAFWNEYTDNELRWKDEYGKLDRTDELTNGMVTSPNSSRCRDACSRRGAHDLRLQHRWRDNDQRLDDRCQSQFFLSPKKTTVTMRTLLFAITTKTLAAVFFGTTHKNPTS